MERSIAKADGSTKQFSIHRDSHTIAKSKPKIRIIHIVAPEIINTDVENFRFLVQRLTGKKSDEAKGTRAKKNGTRGGIIPPRHEDCDQDQHRILESTAQRTKEVQFLFKGSDTGSAGTFGKFGDCMGIKFDQDLGQFGIQPFK